MKLARESPSFLILQLQQSTGQAPQRSFAIPKAILRLFTGIEFGGKQPVVQREHTQRQNKRDHQNNDSQRK